jgi:hypothetical protein
MTAPSMAIDTPNGRYYQHPRTERAVPSITNIIGMKDKPALVGWAAKMSAEFAMDNLESIKGLERQAGIDLIKGARWRSSNSAAAKGDEVHGWIDDWIKAGSPDIAKWTPDGFADAHFTPKNMWKQFCAFTRKYNPTWLASEFTVWNEKVGYAGTGDWIARIGNHVVYGDNKTGNGIYPEVGLQISALVYADHMFDTNGEEVALPKCDKGAVLHVRPRFSRLSPLNHLDKCFAAFCGLREVFEWHVATEDDVIVNAPKVEAAK